jgi:integrase
MRNPSEIIPLSWADIDWNRRTVRVDKGWVDGALKRSTKTNHVRDVHLNDRALAALERAKLHSFMRGEQIFLNPVTHQPHGWDSTLRDGYWNPCLKRLGIRRRVPYNTRHTFATVLLMAGVNPAYIAKQLGHANAKMLFERYAQWIEDAADDRERDKAMREFAPISPRLERKPLK